MKPYDDKSKDVAIARLHRSICQLRLKTLEMENEIYLAMERIADQEFQIRSLEKDVANRTPKGEDWLTEILEKCKLFVACEKTKIENLKARIAVDMYDIQKTEKKLQEVEAYPESP